MCLTIGFQSAQGRLQADGQYLLRAPPSPHHLCQARFTHFVPAFHDTQLAEIKQPTQEKRTKPDERGYS
ncbi:hypothetical protein E8F20_06250 [Pseudomonas sp. BN415]|nr:hypothetical protein [Pseudomonas sp. BN415]